MRGVREEVERRGHEVMLNGYRCVVRNRRGGR